MFTTKKSLRIVMWRQLCYILGKLHFRSAETLLIIEGRSTLSTQLRLSMFKGDAILGGKSRIISGSELSETNNEPTIGFLTPKKVDKKIEKLFLV